MKKINGENKVENGSGPTLRVSMDLERLRAWDCRKRDEEYFMSKSRPVDENVYREECSVLPENFLDGIDLDSMLPDEFKLQYPHGTSCCMAVLPFNDGFFGKNHLSAEKWEAFIKTKPCPFLRALLVQPNGMTQGFADITARYHNLFPDILRKDVSEGGATFKVDFRRNDGRDDREWFLFMCNRALNNLRKFFGQKTEKTSAASLLKLVK